MRERTEMSIKREIGEQRIIFFENGLGVTLLNGFEHEWEVALIRYDKNGEWEIINVPHLIDRVVVCSTPEEVETILTKIERANLIIPYYIRTKRLFKGLNKHFSNKPSLNKKETH